VDKVVHPFPDRTALRAPKAMIGIVKV